MKTPSLALGFLLYSVVALAETSKTTDEARRARAPGFTACSQIQPELVASNLAEGWKRCFSAPGKTADVTIVLNRVPIVLPGMQTAPNQIVNETSGERKTVIVSYGEKEFLFFADIETTADCPARIEIRGATDFINRISTKSARFIEAPQSICPRDDPK